MKQAREIEQVEGSLKEVTADDLRALRDRRREFYSQCHTLADWQALAQMLGYKRGWAWFQHERSRLHRKRA